MAIFQKNFEKILLKSEGFSDFFHIFRKIQQKIVKQAKNQRNILFIGVKAGRSEDRHLLLVSIKT